MNNKINVKFINPTDGSDIDVGIPENMLLRDVLSELVEANFISAGQQYAGISKANGGIQLGNDQTMKENGLSNNDVIQIIISTQADGGPRICFSLISKLCEKYRGLEIHEYEKLDGEVMEEMESLCNLFIEESKKFKWW